MQPVMKISKSRKRKRRSHHALKPIHYVRCPQCSNAKLPHCACSNCGYVNPTLALPMEQDAEQFNFITDRIMPGKLRLACLNLLRRIDTTVYLIGLLK